MSGENKKCSGELLWRSRTAIWAVMISIAGLLAVQFNTCQEGIRFSDEAFYITGAWKLVTSGSISIPKSEIFDEGRPGNFFVPGRNQRYYSMNPVGFSLILSVFYRLAGWPGIVYANRIFFPVILFLLFILFRKCVGDFVALGALSILAVSPIIMVQSVMVMTHVFSLLLQIVGLLILMNASLENIKLRAFWVGVIWGSATIVRLDFVLMSIPLLVTLWIQTRYFHRISRERSYGKMQYVKIALTAVMGFILGMCVLFGYRYFCLGNILKSGYNESYGASIAFSQISEIPRRFIQALKRLQEAGLPYVIFLSIPGAYVFIRKAGRFAGILFSWAVPYFCFYIAFRFGTKHVFNTRYFIPVLPVLALSASVLINSIGIIRRRSSMVIFVFVLLLIPGLWRGRIMLKDRDDVLKRQVELIELIEEKVPSGSVLFLPGSVALTMAVRNEPYDIRETIYVLGPYPDMPDKAESGDGRYRQSRRLMSNSAATTRRRNPLLLPGIMSKTQDGNIYIAMFSRFKPLIERLYNVHAVRIAETHTTRENYVLYRIEGASSSV